MDQKWGCWDQSRQQQHQRSGGMGELEQLLLMRQMSRIKKGLMRRIAVNPKCNLDVLQESKEWHSSFIAI